MTFRFNEASVRLTSGFLGEVLSAVGVVPALGVNVFSEIDEARGSFLGEMFILVGVLLFAPSSFSSSFFFIMASLELVFTGAAVFLGDGLTTSSDTLRLVFDAPLKLPAAASVLLFLGVVVKPCFSSEPLRAWMGRQTKCKF